MKKFFNQNRATLTLVLMVALFVLPILLANILYSHRVTFSRSTTNRGTLITPPIPIAKIHLTLPRTLQGKWLLGLFLKGQCKKACQHLWYLLHQVQTATGKDRNRVGRMILTLDTKMHPYPQKPVRLPPSQALDSLQPKDRTIYLIDPNGYLMMQYPANTPPTHVLRDLLKLLKLSAA